MNYYFITGTSKGIGNALVQTLLKDNKNYIYGISRNVSLTHDQYHHQHLDLSDITALRNNLYKIFVELREPEKIVLINNAGVLGNIAYIGGQGIDNFEFVMNINAIAPAILMNAFISAYQSLSCPKIILNISSGAGQRPVDGWSAYCASKAALDMFSLTCQKEQDLLGTGVKVYSVSPGVVDTDMQEKIREVNGGQFSELGKFINLKNEGKLVDPQAVSSQLLKLINSDNALENKAFRITDILEIL